MITIVLVVLAAVIVLIAVIVLLAWRYLREDDDDGEFRADDTRHSDGLGDQETNPALLAVQDLPPVATEAAALELLDQAWPDQLRAIGEAAAADVLELHPVWDPAAICPQVAAAGMSLEDWDRCYKTPSRRYWADRRKAWKTETLAWWEDYRDWRAEMGLAA